MSNYGTVVLGGNAFKVVTELPVELRDGGIIDFGREDTIAWYPSWERDDEIGPEQDEPCRECRGRGYDRRNPDEPCERCAGEGVEL